MILINKLISYEKLKMRLVFCSFTLLLSSGYLDGGIIAVGVASIQKAINSAAVGDTIQLLIANF